MGPKLLDPVVTELVVTPAIEGESSAGVPVRKMLMPESSQPSVSRAESPRGRHEPALLAAQHYAPDQPGGTDPAQQSDDPQPQTHRKQGRQQPGEQRHPSAASSR